MTGNPRRAGALALIASSFAGQIGIVVGIVALALAVIHGAGPRPPARGAPAPEVPLVYAALTAAPDGPSQTADITIRATRTGNVLATVRPPAPYTTFGMVSGTAYADAYLVLAQRAARHELLGPASGVRDTGQERVMLLKYLPVPHHVYLLPIPSVPAMAGLTIWGAAFSPDLHRLAVQVQPSAGVHQIRVYHTFFGPLVVGGFPAPPPPAQGVRTWTATGRNAFAFGRTPLSPQALSWSGDDRMLAFNWQGPAGQQGLRVLDTLRKAGSLTGSSRLVLPLPRTPSQGSFTCQTDAVLTADGKTVLCGGSSPGGVALADPIAAIGEFSVATGQLTRVVTPPPDPDGTGQASVIWATLLGTS